MTSTRRYALKLWGRQMLLTLPLAASLAITVGVADGYRVAVPAPSAFDANCSWFGVENTVWRQHSPSYNPIPCTGGFFGMLDPRYAKPIPGVCRWNVLRVGPFVFGKESALYFLDCPECDVKMERIHELAAAVPNRCVWFDAPD